MNAPPPRHASGSLHGETLVITVLTEQIRDDVTAYALRDQMVSLIDSAGANRVVLDLHRVKFVGSIGFLAFLGVRRRLEDGQIVICNLTENIRMLFELCRLISKDPSANPAFEEAESLEAALAMCG